MIDLTDNEINRLADMLRDTARAKQKRATEITHPMDQEDLRQSALRDFVLRNKLIAAKRANQGVCPS